MSASATLHVAVDLGASGGRVALGRLEGGRLEVEVLHRFPNGPVPVRGGLYWDVIGLWRETLAGLRLAAVRARELGRSVSSVGVDSWAVDYALLDRHGLVLDGVHHYRDPRTDGVMEEALASHGAAWLFEATGLQFLPGCLSCERTNASTTQFYDPRAGGWSGPVLEACGLPERILPAIVEAGSVLGPLSDAVARDTGLEGAVVIVPGTHDTASAVAAAPLAGPGSAYISSGTWSLVGLETDAPVINGAALEANLTNEAGVNGSNRLLKNVMGLWILQECRRA